MDIQQDLYDVILIGAGPCGVATTKALTKVLPHIKIKVLEARNEYKRGLGGHIDMQSNGQKALKAIDQSMYEKVMTCFTPNIKAFIAIDNEDEQLNYKSAISNGSDMQIRKYVGWSECTHIILESLGSFKDCVQFGAKCDSITVLPDEQKTIQVKLQDGTTYKSKFLIGCDGQFSRVRKSLFSQDHDPSFGDTIFWRGRFSLEALKTLKDLKYDYANVMVNGFGDGIISLTGPISPTEGCLTIGVKSSLLREVGLGEVVEKYENGLAQIRGGLGAQENKHSSDPERTYNNILKALYKYSPNMQQLYSLISPVNLIEHGIFQTCTDKFDEGYISKDNVILLGDASHPGRPAGQGLSVALEDAAVIGQFVKKFGLSNETFLKFAQVRKPRIIQCLKFQQAAGQNAYDLSQIRKFFQNKSEYIVQRAAPVQSQAADYYSNFEIEAL